MPRKPRHSRHRVGHEGGISAYAGDQRRKEWREWIERARRADILGVARNLGAWLRRSGGEHVGPCPVCGGKDRFSVNVKKQLWNCRGCGKGGDTIALVRHVDGVTFAQAVERLTGQQWMPMRTTLHRREPDDRKGDNPNGEFALRIFDGAGPILHARAESAKRYLVHWRNIDIDQIPDLDDVLRFEPRCPFNGDSCPV
jgi:ribosomal protein L37AE/L43A